MKAADSDTAVRAAPSRFVPMLLSLGPGIVLTGGVVGSGELINTPIQAARFGFVLLWAVIISCLIKYFLPKLGARNFRNGHPDGGDLALPIR